MPFQKGQSGNPKGKTPGPNKTTKQVRAILERVHADIGGDDAMAEWATENRTEFYKLWAKLIPVQIGGEDGGAPIVHKIVLTGPDG